MKQLKCLTPKLLSSQPSFFFLPAITEVEETDFFFASGRPSPSTPPRLLLLFSFTTIHFYSLLSYQLILSCLFTFFCNLSIFISLHQVAVSVSVIQTQGWVAGAAQLRVLILSLVAFSVEFGCTYENTFTGQAQALLRAPFQSIFKLTLEWLVGSDLTQLHHGLVGS